MSEKVEIPDPDDLGVPSVDVCAICGDPYCDDCHQREEA